MNEHTKEAIEVLNTTKLKQITGAYFNVSSLEAQHGVKPTCACALGALFMGIPPSERERLYSYYAVGGCVKEYYGFPDGFTDKILNWNDKSHNKFRTIAKKIEKELLTSAT